MLGSKKFGDTGVPLSKDAGSRSTVKKYASSTDELLCQILSFEVKLCERIGTIPIIGSAESNCTRKRGSVVSRLSKSLEVIETDRDPSGISCS